MTRIAGWLAAASLAAAQPTVLLAQEAPEAEADAPAEIVVLGVTDKFRFHFRQLAAATAAFEKGRPIFAPSGSLYFQVWTHRPIGALRLSLRRGSEIIDLPIDADKKFVIPQVTGDGWVLTASGRRGRIWITPLVMSPGTSDGDRLLGDLRLQCRVTWAMSGTSIFAKGLCAAAGGCSSNKFGFYATANRNIAAAVAVSGPISKPIRLWDRNKYRVPTGDRSLPHDARIRLTFED